MGPMINVSKGCKRELYVVTMPFVISLVSRRNKVRI